jgi:catechol 2,3-dioxygenase-like lactoylglutathione lyase family enzyme
MSTPRLGAFSHVAIGVANLDTALNFWQQNFVSSYRPSGPDAALGTLWVLIRGHHPAALVATPAGPDSGPLRARCTWLNSGIRSPVRQGAKAWDLLPKNLDVYTNDMPVRYAELEAAGHQFRTGWTEMSAGQRMFREVQMPDHDEINVVLIENTDPGYDTTMSAKGYAGIGPLVTIVPDAEAETSFYRDVLCDPTMKCN